MSNKQLQVHKWVTSKNQSDTGKIGIRIVCTIHYSEELTVTKTSLKAYGIELPTSNKRGQE